MKYKVGRDIPKLARKYNTLKPFDLVKIVLKEKRKQISPESIHRWFKRNPEVYNRLSKQIKNRSPKNKPKEIPEAYAKLVTYNYGTLQIIDLESVELARKKLAIVEEDFRADLCEKANLNVVVFRKEY